MNDKMKTALKWGLIGSVVLIIFNLILYLLNVPYDSTVRYLGIIILLLVIIIGAMDYRDNLNKGYASFGQLFGFVIMIVLVYGVVSSVYGYINTAFIDTEMIDTILLETEIKLEDQGLSKLEIDQALAWTKKIMSPVGMLIMGFFSVLMSGILIALPTSAVLSKRNHDNVHDNEKIDEY